MTDTDHKKKKCDRCRSHYTKKNFTGKNEKTVSSCNMCRTSISNKSHNKAKENIEEEIKQHQNLAYTQDQLTDILLDFLDPYEDFDNAEPCSQFLNIDIAVFLNSFIDRIETSNEDELNKLIAYRIVKLVSKADGFKDKSKKLELMILRNDEILNLDCHDMNVKDQFLLT
ncbi:9263_t:CDS:2 [Racocetra persica]|uniref:9263_t:CDS:1 n=1 Tax=Racocetra persica TaxID=160502 RepID=A0ACA9NWE5_9GLOM|nr:9263_t:CDS:2 [Racocetra persica]